MRRLRRMAASTGLIARFVYTDWIGSRGALPPKALRRLVGISTSCLALLIRRRSVRDVVHVNTSLYARALLRDAPFLCVALLKGYPTLIQAHGGRLANLESRPFVRWIAHRFMAGATLIGVFPGPQWEEFEESGYGPKMRPMRNMVPGSGKTVYEHDRPPCFLFLGRLTHEKGAVETLNAFITLKNGSGKDMHLIIAGDGPLRDELVSRASESAHADDIEILGFVSGATLDAILDSANVLVLPSRHPEGFPLSFLECAERGIAPIVTRDSAVPQLFKEGVEFLGIRGDASDGELVRKMALLARDPVLRRSLGAAARDAVQRGFTIEAVAPEYIKVYEDLCSL
jgi:glycosyltransferase involved in cell wall biosynthesis